MRTHLVVGALLLAACGQPSGHRSSNSNSNNDNQDHHDSGNGPASVGCTTETPSAFAATPSSFGVPAPRCNQAFDWAASTSTSLNYELSDFTADGQPDLVVASDQCDASVGDSHWDVYPAGASSFAAQPTSYALPAARCNTQFDAFLGYQSLHYALLDLDADHRSDLIVYHDNCDASVGVDHWDVYRGGATGFSAQPTSYSLPAARCNTSFDSLGSAASPLTYGLVDLTGDGRADLVVTHDQCDASVGSDHWDVYPAGDSGFAAQPIAFALPAARCNQPFDSVSGVTSSLTYALVDLDQDARPDLVVTHDDCDPAVGSTHWDFYRAGSSGFMAQPTAYSVPAARCNRAFDSLASSSSVHYQWTKLQCGVNAMIVTSDDCDSAVGTDHWDLYTGDAHGLQAAPTPITLPAPRCNQSFDAAAENVSSLSYLMTDLLPGSTPDLVVTSDQCASDVGASHWDVYPLK